MREALVGATERLQRAGCQSPRVDAELLVRHALGLSRTEMQAAPELALGQEQVLALERGLDRRCAREPLAYILGEWSFRRLDLRVTPDVLVPRPETEMLVDYCLERLAACVDPRVLDIGTGSGAIALAIADEHPGARVTATDISPRALEVARSNADRVGLRKRVRFLEGDLCAGARGPFDLIVSNPPYISPASYPDLEPEVARFEPRLALVGEGFHARIAVDARPLLRRRGRLLLECADGEATEVAGLLRERDWAEVRVLPDLTGRSRVVAARLDEPPSEVKR